MGEKNDMNNDKQTYKKRKTCLILVFLVFIYIFSAFSSAYVIIYPGVEFYGGNITFSTSNSEGINISYLEVGTNYVLMENINLSVSCSNNIDINVSQVNSNPMIAKGASALRFNATYSTGSVTFSFNGNISNPIYKLYRDSIYISTHTTNTFTFTYTGWSTHDFDIRAFSYPDPPYNGDSEYTRTLNTVNLTWTSGNYSDRDIVVMKASGYPSSSTDGTVYQNSTDTFYNFTANSSSGYFSVFSYNITSQSYSLTGLNIPWGALTINVYKETNISIEILNYSVLITNRYGTETYYATLENNPFYIDINDIPVGTNSIIQISKDGYYQRSKTLDLLENVFYNLTFYLAPHPDGGGDPDEPDYIPPQDYSTTLQTTSQSVSNHAVDNVITLDCTPSSIVQVQGYNKSLYGHWFVIPEDKYELDDNNITVNATVLDANTSTLQVQYYCSGTEQYGYQYLITVVDQTDRAIESARITVSAYDNTTNTWSSVYIVDTDSSGQTDMYLIAGNLYKFQIVKTGYTAVYADWIPSENVFNKKFQMTPTAYVYPNATSPSECITITHGYSGTTGFVDIDNNHALCGDLTNFSIIVYEINLSTGNTSWFYSYNSTNVYGENVTFNINISNNYVIYVTINHSLFPTYQTVLYITPEHPTPPHSKTSVDEFNTFFELLFGKNNSLTWSAILGLFIFIVCLFAFDQRNAGFGLVVTGFIVLGFNAWFGLAIINVMICVFIVIMGILLQWKLSRKYG